MEEPWPLWLRASVAALLALEAVLGLLCNALVLAAGGACGRCRHRGAGNGAGAACRKGPLMGSSSWGGASVGGRGSAVSVSIMVTASMHALDLLISAACIPIAAAVLLLPMPVLVPALAPTVPLYPGMPPPSAAGTGANLSAMVSAGNTPVAFPSVIPLGCRDTAGTSERARAGATSAIAGVPRVPCHRVRRVRIRTSRDLPSSATSRPSSAGAGDETTRPVISDKDGEDEDGERRGWWLGSHTSGLYTLHEACASFAGVATSTGVLLVTLDRYDMGVRPTSRLLTPRRAGIVLAVLWALSAAAFACPLAYPDWIVQWQQPNDRLDPSAGNESSDGTTSGCGRSCVAGSEGRLRFNHLMPQVPVFLLATGAMLLTYGKIVRTLRFRFISGLHGASAKPVAQAPPPAAVPVGATPAPAPAPCKPAPMGVHTSVAVVLAIKRAVRRHRERRARKRRVLRTSLAIICSFTGCWAPVQALNLVLAATARASTASGDDGELALRLRPALLALAYATAVLHPALYGFTRQGVREVIAAVLFRCPAGSAGTARPRFHWRCCWWRHVPDGTGREPGRRAERGLPDGAEDVGEEAEGLRDGTGASVSPGLPVTPEPAPGGRALARLRVEVTQLSDTTERCLTEIVTTRE